MNTSFTTSTSSARYSVAEFVPHVAPPHRLVLPVGFALFAVLSVAGVCGNSYLLRAIARRWTPTSSSSRGYAIASVAAAHVPAADALLGLLLHAAIANLATTACALPLSLAELVLHRVGRAASLLCHFAQLTFLVRCVAAYRSFSLFIGQRTYSTVQYEYSTLHISLRIRIRSAASWPLPICTWRSRSASCSRDAGSGACAAAAGGRSRRSPGLWRCCSHFRCSFRCSER